MQKKKTHPKPTAFCSNELRLDSLKGGLTLHRVLPKPQGQS